MNSRFAPPVICEQWYTLATVHAMYEFLVPPSPNIRVMIQAIYDAREVGNTRYLLPSLPPPPYFASNGARVLSCTHRAMNLPAVIHASYHPRALRSETPSSGR